MGLGNRQNKKAAPSFYTAGLITAFAASYITGDYQTDFTPGYPPWKSMKAVEGKFLNRLCSL